MMVATRTSVARSGLTERNNYFAFGKMQADPDSPLTLITTLWVVIFIGIGILMDKCTRRHCVSIAYFS